MNTEQQPPSVLEIAALAESLGVQFTEHETTFDLDRRDPTLEGTYRKTPAGIEAAYGDLMRHRLLLKHIQQPGPTADVVLPHLALDCKLLPGNLASFLKAMSAYLDDQADPTGLKVHNLREMAKSLHMTFERIDGLLRVIERREQQRQLRGQA